MAEISGENGAVYWNEELTATALADSVAYSTNSISSTHGGDTGIIDFESCGYTSGMLFTLTGASGVAEANNRTYTISAVSCGVLTVVETIDTQGTDSGTPTFSEADPGVQVLGFYNWTLNYTGDAAEVTDFDSSGCREYIPGLISWTASADSYFQTTGNKVNDWVGETVEIRLFLNYESTPASTAISQYWKGDTVVNGMDVTTPVDAIITQNISFQGDGAIELKTQNDPWSCGIS